MCRLGPVHGGVNHQLFWTIAGPILCSRFPEVQFLEGFLPTGSRPLDQRQG